MPDETNSGNERITNASSADAAQLFLLEFPPLPDDIRQRFPSMVQWEQNVQKWVKQATFNIRGAL